MATTDAAKNTMLDALAPDLIKLHSGDPGAAGTANEISGASGAATYAAASAGSREITGTVAIPVTLPDANPITVSHYSIWAGATLLFYGPMTSAAETYSNSGTANVTSAPLTVT